MDSDSNEQNFQIKTYIKYTSEEGTYYDYLNFVYETY